MQRDRSMAVDVISEFLHSGGPPLNADDAAIAIVDVLEREGFFNLDRVRDARGDEEAPLMAPDPDVSGADDYEGQEGPQVIRSPQGEDHEAGLPEPQSVKDYKDLVLNAEAERAALRAFLGDGHMHPANERALLVKLHRAIAAYLSRVPPSRDGSVAVEDVLGVLRRIGEMAGAKANGADARAMGLLARKALAEFSPTSTGDQAPKEENDRGRP